MRTKAMKIKCAIIGLCLMSLAVNLSAQEAANWRDYNGYKWKEYDRSKYFGTYQKFSYITSVMLNGKNVSGRMANYLKSMLDPETRPFKRRDKESNKTESQLMKEVNWLLDKVTPSENYGGATIGQYIDGLDEFYNDQNNIQIPIPLAMIVVKKRVKGEPEEEIDKYIAELRTEYAGIKNEQ